MRDSHINNFLKISRFRSLIWISVDFIVVFNLRAKIFCTSEQPKELKFCAVIGLSYISQRHMREISLVLGSLPLANRRSPNIITPNSIHSLCAARLNQSLWATSATAVVGFSLLYPGNVVYCRWMYGRCGKSGFWRQVDLDLDLDPLDELNQYKISMLDLVYSIIQPILSLNQ